MKYIYLCATIKMNKYGQFTGGCEMALDRNADMSAEMRSSRNLMMSLVKAPDLMIYLRASVPHLVGNIQKRGREYEQAIQLEYLQNLNERYDDFIFHKYPGKVMTIDKDTLDYQNNPKDLATIIDRIDNNLFGLFPE